MSLEIQQSVNQILASAQSVASVGKIIKQQQEANQIQKEMFEAQEREREYNKPENVKARRIAELNEQAKTSITSWNDRVNSLTAEGYSAEEAEAIASKDLDKELSIYEELYDLGEKDAMKNYAETFNQAQVAREQWAEKQKQQQSAEDQKLKQQQLAEEQKMAQVAAAERNKAESDFIRDVIMNPGKYPPNAIQEYKAKQSIIRKVN